MDNLRIISAGGGAGEGVDRAHVRPAFPPPECEDVWGAGLARLLQGLAAQAEGCRALAVRLAALLQTTAGTTGRFLVNFSLVKCLYCFQYPTILVWGGGKFQPIQSFVLPLKVYAHQTGQVGRSTTITLTCSVCTAERRWRAQGRHSTAWKRCWAAAAAARLTCRCALLSLLPAGLLVL